MNYVEPIRDIRDIERMKTALLKHSYRDYILFTVGINVGMRIGDILTLKVSDVQGRYIELREEKTGKQRRHYIHDTLRHELERYTQDMNHNAYLFSSRKGIAPISTVQAYRILNGVSEELGLPFKVGTHTLKKTFGYHHYAKHKDVALLQDIFNHSSPSITLRYLGINQDRIDDTLKDFYL